MKPEFPKFKVAAVQASSIIKDAPQWFDTRATVDKATNLISEAARNGARLIVFPECWLPCYPYWALDFTDRRGFNEIWANFLWNSVEVPGPETEALGKASKEADAYLVMGISERDRYYPGRMYNSILYMNPRGEVLGVHRKIVNTVQERLFHTAGDGGDNLKTVFDTELGRIGGSICGEHCQLLLLYNWLMQGMQIHCSLWSGEKGIENYTDLVSRSFCRIGHVFGVLSATFIAETDMPKKFYRNALFNIPGAFRGGSGIVDPAGQYIAGPVYDKETIVYADIDLAEIDKNRFANNLPGYYSRWDILNLNVSGETYQPLMPMRMGKQSVSAEEKQVKELEERITGLELQITLLSKEIAKSL